MKTTGISDSHEFGVDVQFLQVLVAIDESVAEGVRAAHCPSCGSRLDRADYPRKPRGGALAPEVEGWSTRFSFCCSREGCRRRATPPSVRFLGRRVYAELVVVLASVHAQLLARASALREATGVPVRTIRRWLSWWRSVFLASALWGDARARMVPAPEPTELPGSLLERFTPTSALLDMARFMAPSTTGSVPDGSRFVRVAM